jgi:hypothetical protein
MKKISSFLCAAAIAFSGVPAAISAPQNALTVFAEDQPENGDRFTEGALTFWVIRESDEKLGLWLKECDPKAEAEICTVPESVKGLPVTKVNSYAFNECKNLKEIVIPDSVTEINEWAFFGCSSLTKIRLPKNLTVLENDLFHGCSALETVEIPETVTKISGFAFCNCTNLSSLTLPENLEAIGYNAFLNTPALTALTIPKSVKQIDKTAFNWTGKKEGENFTLYVYKDSYALEFAIENDFNYVVIDGEQPPQPEQPTEPEQPAEPDQPEQPPVTEPMLGDTDGGGEITVSDAQNVLAAYVESLTNNGESSLTDEQKAAYDVDGDGEITVADAQYILIYYTENQVAGNPVTWEELIPQEATE